MKESWTFHHIGIAVVDLDKSMQDYGTLTAQTSFKQTFVIDSSKAAEYLVYGKPPDPVVRTRAVMGQVGPLGVELLQPVQGDTVHSELLEAKGEGVGHIAFTVEDLEAETAQLEAQGFEVILSIKPAGGNNRSAVYIDTRGRLSGLIIELMQA
ncbi:MAG: VOC family protein [Pseudomonadales bacterium]|jgi:methylmalonyl-CoA/ethylmalonyl-CoA epimerase|nr:VOC family protein [Pseudomonadales bacterium]